MDEWLDGKTSDPLFARIALARLINEQMRSSAVTAWDVDQLPEDWLDAFRVLASEGRTQIDARRTIEAIRANWLARHPTYRKRL